MTLKMNSSTIKSTRSSTTRFDDLPNELISMIFDQLSWRNLLVCRQVNKKFRKFSEECRINELVTSGVAEDHRSIWYNNKKFISYKESFKFEYLPIMRSIFCKLDQSLKYLHINLYRDYDHDSMFSIVNQFKQLIELEIISYFDLMGNQKFTLSLPLLRSLHFASNILSEENRNTYTLDTPKLQKLKCNRLKDLDVIYPTSIKHLEMYGDYNQSQIDSMINIEHLQCNWSSSSDRDILSKLIKIKEFFCFAKFSYNPYENYPNLLDDIRYIFKQKLILRRTDLQIYLHGVQLTDRSVIESYSTSWQHFQIDNYQLLFDGLETFTTLDYTKITECMHKVPDDLTTKFNIIRSIVIDNQVTNQTELIDLIKKTTFLSELKFSRTSFDQTFIDNLPIIRPQLTDIEFNHCPIGHLDFEFIFELKLLENVVIFKCSIDLFPNFALQSFSKLKYLRQFDNANEARSINIQRSINNYSIHKIYEIRESKKNVHRYDLDYDELSLVCKKLLEEDFQ